MRGARRMRAHDEQGARIMTPSRFLATTSSILAIALATSACAGAETKEEDPTKTAEYHYKMAVGHFKEHQVPMAIRELTVALEIDNDHGHSHYLMGYIFMGRRDYTKAVRHFKEALRIDSNFHDARNALGATYLAMERWSDAAEQFEILIEEPMYATPEIAHNNLGWSYYNRRKHSRALEHFKMATFLKPGFCLGHNNVGLAMKELNNNEGAIKSWRKAIELCPSNYAEPHFHLGRALQEFRDPQAYSHFERCAQLQPNSTLGERCRRHMQMYQ
jgi:type IV pilus assembly protein PilF